MRVHRGMLPARLFLGCGTREYSATRDHVRDDVDGLLLGYCHEAARILEEQVRGGVRACRTVAPSSYMVMSTVQLWLRDAVHCSCPGNRGTSRCRLSGRVAVFPGLGYFPARCLCYAEHYLSLSCLCTIWWQGMAGGRLRFLVEEGAGHHELAWQWRLTGGLRFVCGPWWDE